MASLPPIPSRRPSMATILLVAAALVALVSAAVAISRTMRADAPAAKDWRVVGWAHGQAGNAAESAAAFRKAAAIEPDNAENWSSLGEALQAASRSVVPEAAAAFRKALELDPNDPRARYFLAAQKDLGGDPKGAVEDWLALLRDAPPGTPWEAELRRTIEQSAARSRIDLAGRLPAPGAGTMAPTVPGPSAEQLAAAAAMPRAQQEALVRQMVERLEARLKAAPKDEEGWIRLMRARTVLGQPDRAAAALRSALVALKGDAAAEARLRDAAAGLGIPSAG